MVRTCGTLSDPPLDISGRIRVFVVGLPVRWQKTGCDAVGESKCRGNIGRGLVLLCGACTVSEYIVSDPSLQS